MKTTILFLLALIAVAIAVDYCNTNLCDDGSVHIACENNGVSFWRKIQMF